MCPECHGKISENFKKIIKVALVNKWITDDPFLEIHFKQTKTNRAFLTEEELNILLKRNSPFPACKRSGTYSCFVR